jgi:hypothetical protein
VRRKGEPSRLAYQGHVLMASALDGRTTRHVGYAESPRRRKRVEEIFGWLKTVGLLRKTRHRGVERVGWTFLFSLAVYNLVRMRNLGFAGMKPQGTKVPEAGGEGVARAMETVPSLAPRAYEFGFRRRDAANPARRGRLEHDAPSPPASGCACRPSSAACQGGSRAPVRTLLGGMPLTESRHSVRGGLPEGCET